MAKQDFRLLQIDAATERADAFVLPVMNLLETAAEAAGDDDTVYRYRVGIALLVTTIQQGFSPEELAEAVLRWGREDLERGDE